MNFLNLFLCLKRCKKNTENYSPNCQLCSSKDGDNPVTPTVSVVFWKT